MVQRSLDGRRVTMDERKVVALSGAVVASMADLERSMT
jgi:hypothetical protein